MRGAIDYSTENADMEYKEVDIGQSPLLKEKLNHILSFGWVAYDQDVYKNYVHYKLYRSCSHPKYIEICKLENLYEKYSGRLELIKGKRGENKTWLWSALVNLIFSIICAALAIALPSILHFIPTYESIATQITKIELYIQIVQYVFGGASVILLIKTFLNFIKIRNPVKYRDKIKNKMDQYARAAQFLLNS